MLPREVNQQGNILSETLTKNYKNSNKARLFQQLSILREFNLMKLQRTTMPTTMRC